ncbi:MAG: aminotransferase class I/II-fold pyridoxal phosphate-dependent enzyme [Candidatus Micrarchaeia archaeon]
MTIKPSNRSGLVAYPIRDIVIEAKKIEATGKKMSYLNIGDPCVYGFRPPEHIINAVREALDKNYSGYAPSQGDPELVKCAAESEGVDEKDLFVTAGLSEGIDFLFQAMLDPGHNFILPSPTYPLYLTKERIYFGSENFYKSDENLQPDIDDLRKRITPYTQALVLINPNNPTGVVYPKKRVQEFIDVAGEYNLPIISDNAYDMLVLEGEYPDIRKMHKDVPLIVGNSISKNYIYPGARIAWLSFFGEGLEGIKDAVQRLCNQRLSVNWEMQKGAIAALTGPKDHIEEFKSDLRKRRDVTVRRVKEIDGLSLVAPNATFYAFPKIESDKWKTDWDFVRDLLKEGVVTVPGKGFSSDLDGLYFRMVFLPNETILNDAFDKIEMLMGSKK